MAATAPRTLREAKATYSTNSELAWWVFMRVSGFLLIFLTFGHLWMYNIAMNAGEIDFFLIVERQALSWVRIYDTFLLGLAMLHGVNGLRYSVEDYIKSRSARAWAKIALYSVTVAVFVFGLMTLWAFNFEEMSAALRAAGQ
jgi:succinate dehydrogenase / fumarate reductase, membrane anchor subunit